MLELLPLAHEVHHLHSHLRRLVLLGALLLLLEHLLGERGGARHSAGARLGGGGGRVRHP